MNETTEPTSEDVLDEPISDEDFINNSHDPEWAKEFMALKEKFKDDYRQTVHDLNSRYE